MTKSYYFLSFNSDTVERALLTHPPPKKKKPLSPVNGSVCSGERGIDTHTSGKAGLIFHQLSKYDYLSILCKSVKIGWIVWQGLINKRKDERETANRVRSKGSVLSQTP